MMTLDDLRELVGAECVRMAKLGSAQAIADELASRSMYGKRTDETQCPLARGIADTLMMSCGRLHVRPQGIATSKPLPGSSWEYLVVFQEGFGVLRDFVERFDHGAYSNLVQA